VSLIGANKTMFASTNIPHDEIVGPFHRKWTELHGGPARRSDPHETPHPEELKLYEEAWAEVKAGHHRP
jgi:hypothetical protein